MSALPPKADMCGALAHVCYGLKAAHAVQQKESLFERLRWSGIPASPAFFKPSLIPGSDDDAQAQQANIQEHSAAPSR
jgi:hypothetical protein